METTIKRFEARLGEIILLWRRAVWPNRLTAHARSNRGTVVLVTAVCSKKPREGIDFFPLTVEYQERTYAAARYRAVSLNGKAGLPKKRY